MLHLCFEYILNVTLFMHVSIAFKIQRRREHPKKKLVFPSFSTHTLINFANANSYAY